MSPARPTTALLMLLSASAPVGAAPPAGDAVQDEMLVVGRTVMPRVAYRALEPAANPVRVQATVFPGRVFHGVVDGLVGRLAGDDELGERAPLLATGPAAGTGPAFSGAIPQGPGLQGPGTSAGGRGTGGAIGGAVLRATSGLADRVGQAVQRTTATGVGP